MSGIFSNRVLPFALLIASIACGPASFAQDEQSETVEPSSAATEREENRDRLIYIPFEDLQKVLRTQDGSAVIPYEDYLRLMKSYMERRPGNTTLAPDAVIKAANYQARTDGDVARITASYQIEVLKREGWAKLDLNFGDLAVGSLKSPDKKNMILKGIEHGRFELLINQAGSTTVEFELLAEISTSPEDRSFKLSCPSVAISNFALTVDEADQNVRVTPLQVQLPSEAAADKTVFNAMIGAAQSVTVRWAPEAGSQPIMDLLTSVTNRTSVRIEPGLIQKSAELNYEILRGEMSEVSVKVPLNDQIIDVVSPGGLIRDWKASAIDDKFQKIDIDLISPAQKSLTVNIQTEQTSGESEATDSVTQLVGTDENGRLQGIHADGVVREAGTIELSTDSSLTPTIVVQKGVKRVESNAKKQAWQFSGTTGQLVVETKPVEPRLQVEQIANVIFDQDELTLNSTLKYTIDRAGIFQLKLKYPSDLTIRSVKADGMSEFNVDQADGEINIELTRKRQGKLSVFVTASRSFDSTSENVETSIPTIEPINVERETGQLTVFAPRFLDVAADETSLNGLVTAEATGSGKSGQAERVAMWTYSQRPINLDVRTSPRPSMVSAFVASTVNVATDTMKVSSTATFDVQNAGVDTFRIQVPEAVADQVTLSPGQGGYRIQQREKSDAEDGWVTWSLTLSAERLGKTQIKAEWTIPLTGLDQAGSVQNQTFAPIKVLEPFDRDAANRRKVTLTQTRGEIRFLRDDSLSLEATAEGETMEPIDIRELEQLPKDGYLAYRYFAQPVATELEIRRHEIHEVVATVISKAAIEISTDEQRLARYRARYEVQTSERQRLRVDLPASAEIQAPLLNGSRTTLEPATDIEAGEGWKAFYVNISRKTQSNTAFVLTVEFRAPITDEASFPYQGRGSRQILRLPLVGDNTGNTVMQETRVAVWCPQQISLVGEPRNWALTGQQQFSLWNPLRSPSSPAEANRLNDWIGGQAAAGNFATQGNVTVYRTIGRQDHLKLTWWNRPFLVGVMTIGLVLIALVLRRTTWENRLTLVVLVGVAVCIWAMKDGSEALQLVTAGSLGFAAVAAIWILSSVLGLSRKGKSKSRPDSGPTDPGDSGGNAQTPPPAPESPTASMPVAVTPSPDVSQMIDNLMGGKS